MNAVAMQGLLFGVVLLVLAVLFWQGWQSILKQLDALTQAEDAAAVARRQAWVQLLDKEMNHGAGQFMPYPERWLAVQALTRLDELDVPATLPPHPAQTLSADQLQLRSSDLLVTLLIRVRRMQRAIAVPTKPDWNEVEQLALEVGRVAMLLNVAAARIGAAAEKTDGLDGSDRSEKLDAPVAKEALESWTSANEVKVSAA